MTNSLRFALLLLCILESTYEQKYNAEAFERMNVSVLQHFSLSKKNPLDGSTTYRILLVQ